jgi:type IV pilus assembly protein PilE
VTLLELMAVVVVIGVLGMIALPSYRQYTMRAHRTEAKAALLRIAAAQERFYLTNNRYGTLAELEAAGFPTTSDYGVYTLDIEDADAVTYTATATPADGGGTNGVDMTADAHCAEFSITATGVRDATNDDCW